MNCFDCKNHCEYSNPLGYCYKEQNEATMKELDEKIKKVSERGTWKGVDVDEYLNEVRGGLTWKDICLIAETIFGMLGRNINDELMGRYDSPKEFYEKVLKKI